MHAETGNRKIFLYGVSENGEDYSCGGGQFQTIILSLDESVTAKPENRNDFLGQYRRRVTKREHGHPGDGVETKLRLVQKVRMTRNVQSMSGLAVGGLKLRVLPLTLCGYEAVPSLLTNCQLTVCFRGI